jgi:hypothetical protein
MLVSRVDRNLYRVDEITSGPTIVVRQFYLQTRLCLALALREKALFAYGLVSVDNRLTFSNQDTTCDVVKILQ